MNLIVISAFLILILLAGCTSTVTRAAELFETAQFEEKQNNLGHATQLYQEIVATYPKSPVAREAAARLDELRQKKP